jgi:hypothetical protein
LYTLGVNLSGTGNPVAIKGGEYAVFADGNFSTGGMSLQMQSPSGAWIDVQMYGAFIRSTQASMLQVGLLLPAGMVRIATTDPMAYGVNAYLAGMG